MNFKNNSKILGWVIVIVFSTIVIINEIRRNKIFKSIRDHKATITAKTIGCTKNSKSSMYTIRYTFLYKSLQYYGSEQFNKEKRGDICSGYSFLVEFDSINPVNNRIILDSLR